MNYLGAKAVFGLTRAQVIDKISDSDDTIEYAFLDSNQRAPGGTFKEWQDAYEHGIPYEVIDEEDKTLDAKSDVYAFRNTSNGENILRMFRATYKDDTLRPDPHGGNIVVTRNGDALVREQYDLVQFAPRYTRRPMPLKPLTEEEEADFASSETPDDQWQRLALRKFYRWALPQLQEAKRKRQRARVLYSTDREMYDPRSLIPDSILRLFRLWRDEGRVSQEYTQYMYKVEARRFYFDYWHLSNIRVRVQIPGFPRRVVIPEGTLTVRVNQKLFFQAGQVYAVQTPRLWFQSLMSKPLVMHMVEEYFKRNEKSPTPSPKLDLPDDHWMRDPPLAQPPWDDPFWGVPDSQPSDSNDEESQKSKSG